MIMSTSSFTVMQFADRKFLAGHSLAEFQAVAPAGMVSFTLLSLFFGTSSYVNTFVSQYVGAERFRRVGTALWQGIYFAFFAWLLMLPFVFCAEFIFNTIKHNPEIIPLEVKYFRILHLGTLFVLLNMALSAFFSGRGKTWTVMWVRFLAMFVNIPLDYCMIFGKWGFPEMGIEGAAIATVSSTALTTIVFTILILSPKNRIYFALQKAWQLEKELFGRLLKYGVPSGMQFVVDSLGFTVFLLLLGRLGSIELAATNAAWSLNMLVFMPMIGISIGQSILVGQGIGAKRIGQAVRVTHNAFYMTFAYMGLIGLLFLIIPRTFLTFLLSDGQEQEIFQVIEMAVVFLRFVALYSLFDAVGLVFCSTIKSAGDTKFVMWVSAIMSLGLLIVPSYLFTSVWKTSANVLWGFAAAYIISVSLCFLWRYLQGHWRNMRIIEDSE